ncbi:MAG: hypothetical protein GY756_27335 [bacterium]|nr:hypothetical protein [bacterium]
MNNQKIYECGIEKANPIYILFENVLIIGNLLAGFIGMYSVKTFGFPVLSVFYLIFVLTMLIFVLRKHLCTQCYSYGKSCHCGWGKLAEKLYKKGAGNQKLGGILAGVTWAILMGTPIIAITILIFVNFTYTALICLIICVIITAINNILHVKDCKECKMRDICPGSAYKNKS